MAGRLHFPPPDEAALAWSALYPVGGAFQQYLPRQAKARIPLGYSIDWWAKAVSKAAKGLARSGDRLHSPNPAVSRRLLAKILIRNLRPDAFVQAVQASWAFLFRVQSECLLLAIQLPDEKPDEDSVLNAAAAKGTWSGHIAKKLRRRKHVAAGLRAGRKCIRDKCSWGSFGIHAP